MVSSSPKEDKNKEENMIKDVRNVSRIEKKNEAIKDRIIRDIRSLLSMKEKIINQ